jgi:hypothetical protein
MSTPNPYYCCGPCKYKTLSRKEMDDHWETPDHLKYFKHLRCDTCDMQFWNHDTLGRHLKTSSHRRLAKIIISCEMCDYSTYSKQLMEQHEQTQSHIDRKNGIIKPDKYSCDKCGYVTKFKSQFEQHELTKKHKNNMLGVEKPAEYCCDACEYTTPFKHCLDQHFRTQKHIKNSTQS